MNEQGSADLLVMLLLLLSIELGIWKLATLVGQQITESYAAMDPIVADEKLERKSFEALGKEWAAPAPRIDFGADNKHGKDAEALCYVVSRFGCAAPGRNFRCN